MADAEAICEAALRPTMRFVPVKSEAVQGAAMVFRICELLIRQRTQAINALRGHLAEFGQVVPQGVANASKLIARRARENAVARRLMTVPGIGPLIATAIAVLAPPPETFRRARDFAAWLGLVPRQHSTGGQQRHHQAARPPSGAPGHLAGQHAGAQAADAGRGGAGQQDGADRLGPDGAGRRLSVSGRGGISRPSAARASERKRARSGMAQQS